MVRRRVTGRKVDEGRRRPVGRAHLVQFEQLFRRVRQLAQHERRVDVDLLAERAHHLLAVVAVGEHARRRDEAVHRVADGAH